MVGGQGEEIFEEEEGDAEGVMGRGIRTFEGGL